MLSCKEVTIKIASEEIARAGLWERIAVRIHLLMCRHCRAYAAQLRQLGEAIRDVWGKAPDDSERVERLERSIVRSASDKRAHSARPGPDAGADAS